MTPVNNSPSAVELRELLENAGNPLAGSWDWLLTGTFAKNIKDLNAGVLVRDYFKSLESRLQIPIPRFWILEPHPHLRRSHVHALVGNLANITGSAKLAHAYWKRKPVRGRFQTLPITDQEGAVRYVVKYVLKTGVDGEWDLRHPDKFRDYHSDCHYEQEFSHPVTPSYLETLPRELSESTGPRVLSSDN